MTCLDSGRERKESAAPDLSKSSSFMRVAAVVSGMWREGGEVGGQEARRERR